MQAYLKMVSSNLTVPHEHKITNNVLKISVRKQYSKVFMYSCNKKKGQNRNKSRQMVSLYLNNKMSFIYRGEHMCEILHIALHQRLR